MRTLTMSVCTRNRAGYARRAIAGLEAQSDRDFELIVADQSDDEVPGLTQRPRTSHGLTVLRDTGRGLSRARNAVLATATTEWVAFVDDDCLVDEDWVAQLRDALRRHPGVAYVAGHVEPSNMPSHRHLAAAARPVPRERVLQGRRVRPQEIGFGVCMAVRRDVARELGGWDERFGAGTAEFPAAEDGDFNFRLLRSGAAALVTPRMRAQHDQWRTPAETVRLYEGYARSWAAFAMKHVRTGDLRGGAWLWSIGARAQARMLASAVRHRSRLRARVACAQLRGLWSGTASGLARQW